MSKVYIYVVDRDFGFAPNPFHGYCSLSTCKPKIRSKAKVGDWVIGMGGGRLGATGRCVYAMRISATLTFDEYWSNAAYLDKKPVRNGSSKMMVGDNIYHYDSKTRNWKQADSHHSNADGSVNRHNLNVDTQTDKVHISRHFYYFGIEAPIVPRQLVNAIGYKNGRSHRVFLMKDCVSLIDWIETSHHKSLNTVTADPFDFDRSEKRYSVKGNKIS
jgi:hypothetical protein